MARRISFTNCALLAIILLLLCYIYFQPVADPPAPQALLKDDPNPRDGPPSRPRIEEDHIPANADDPHRQTRAGDDPTQPPPPPSAVAVLESSEAQAFVSPPSLKEVILEADPSLVSTLEEIANKNRGLLVTTMANSAHMRMTLNWVENMKRQEVACFVFCIDRQLATDLASRGVPSALIPAEWLPSRLREWRNNMGSGAGRESTFGKQDYIYMTHFKASMVLFLLTHNFKVVFSDVDVAWIRPGVLAHLKERMAASPETVLFGTDEMHDVTFQAPYLNTGMYLMLPSPEAVNMMVKTMEFQTANYTVMDQHCFNFVVDWLGYKNTPLIQSLDVCLFQNGAVYFLDVQRCNKAEEPHTAHANYMMGIFQKEQAMRGHRLWYID